MTTVNKEYIKILASGTRTGDPTVTDISDAHGVGVQVVVNVNSISAGSLVATIQGKDLISSKYYDILSSGPLLASAIKTLTVYPGIAVVANSTASTVVPYTWRVSIVSASGTASYSVGASVID